jgi:hypothetical protein
MGKARPAFGARLGDAGAKVPDTKACSPLFAVLVPAAKPSGHVSQAAICHQFYRTVDAAPENTANMAPMFSLFSRRVSVRGLRTRLALTGSGAGDHALAPFLAPLDDFSGRAAAFSNGAVGGGVPVSTPASVMSMGRMHCV